MGTGMFMGGLTGAADSVGKEINDDPCEGTSNFAQYGYCKAGEWLSNAVACSYGESTPQYRNCKGDGGGEDGGGDKPPTDDKPKDDEKPPAWQSAGQTAARNGTIVRSGGYRLNSVRETSKGFNKWRRGKVLQNFADGSKLVFDQKFKNQINGDDFTIVMSRRNNRGVILENIVFRTENGNGYLFEMPKAATNKPTSRYQKGTVKKPIKKKPRRRR